MNCSHHPKRRGLVYCPECRSAEEKAPEPSGAPHGSESSVNGFRCRSVFLGQHQTPVLEIDVTPDQESRMVWRDKNNPPFCVVPSDMADRMNDNQLAILGFDWRDEFRRRFGPEIWAHVTFRIPNDERMHHYQRRRTSITGLGW